MRKKLLLFFAFVVLFLVIKVAIASDPEDNKIPDVIISYLGKQYSDTGFELITEVLEESGYSDDIAKVSIWAAQSHTEPITEICVGDIVLTKDKYIFTVVEIKSLDIFSIIGLDKTGIVVKTDLSKAEIDSIFRIGDNVTYNEEPSSIPFSSEEELNPIPSSNEEEFNSLQSSSDDSDNTIKKSDSTQPNDNAEFNSMNEISNSSEVVKSESENSSKETISSDTTVVEVSSSENENSTIKVYRSDIQPTSCKYIESIYGNIYYLFYEKRPIENVVYEIYTDQECQEKIGSETTNKEGIVVFTDLQPDSYYYLREISVPENIAKNSSILVCNSSAQKMYEINAFLDEEGEQAQRNLKVKIFDRSESQDGTLQYNETPLSDSFVGLYTKQAIYSYDGNLLVEANSLIGIAKTDENGIATFNSYVPFGSYFFKELQVPEGKSLDLKEYNFNIDSNKKIIVSHSDTNEAMTIEDLEKTESNTFNLKEVIAHLLEKIRQIPIEFIMLFIIVIVIIILFFCYKKKKSHHERGSQE